MRNFRKISKCLNNVEKLKNYRSFVVNLGFVINIAMAIQVLSVKDFTINYLYAFVVMLAFILVIALPIWISVRIRNLTSTPI